MKKPLHSSPIYLNQPVICLRRKWVCTASVIAAVSACLMFAVFMYCTSLSQTRTTATFWHYSAAEAQEFASRNVLKHLKLRLKSYTKRNLSYDRIRSDSDAQFNIRGDDVIVFLHIQKTAGTTFEKNLVKNLDLERPCKCLMRKRCQCYRPKPLEAEDEADLLQEGEHLWLFSRYSTGWSCGLHADWTELATSDCVDNVLDEKEKMQRKRRYFYTTFLREPVSRYISEFRHVQRGATWKSSPHVCNGRPATPSELPLCFDPEIGWEGVSLNEFLSCPYNLANNRQTRMLADLTLVGCYNKSHLPPLERDAIMLQSAKKNLRDMAFFGLQEAMHKSQYVFERTFGLHFKKVIKDGNFSKSSDTDVTAEQLIKLKEVNHLDIELYDFGRKIFYERFEELKRENNMFEFDYHL